MNIQKLRAMRAIVMKAIVQSEDIEIPQWRFDGMAIKTAEEVALACSISIDEAIARIEAKTMPGWEGSVGPFPSQYGQLHVYARDVHSGAGNCVCGRSPESTIHATASKDVYGASGAHATTVSVGTHLLHAGIRQRANALAYGKRRRRRRHKRREQ